MCQAMLPWTPGNDGAGTVERTGPDYNGTLKTGDRVYLAGALSGTYAEFALVDPEQVYKHPH